MSRSDLLERMHRDLHDLCQPLTALQCRLEIARMLGCESDLKQAIDGGLEESQRIFAAVAKLRDALAQMEEEGRLDAAGLPVVVIGHRH